MKSLDVRTGSTGSVFHQCAKLRRALYPIHEARELLGGISHTAFYEMAKRGEIHIRKIGRRSFVAAEEIQRIASGEV